MYSVSIKHDNEMIFSAQSKQHTITIDAKAAQGFTPPDLLLASLGSCIGVYIRKYTKNTSIDFHGFVIHVSGDLCAEHPSQFKEITVTVELNTPIDEKRKASLLRFIHHCPIHSTIIGNPKININL